MYVCGADLVVRCSYMRSMSAHGVVCVARHDERGSADVVRSKLPILSHIHFVELPDSMPPEDLSSTKVRQRLADGERVDDLMVPCAAEYLIRVLPRFHPSWAAAQAKGAWSG